MPHVFTYDVQRSSDDTGYARFLFSLIDPVPDKVLDEALKLRHEIESTNRDIWIILGRLQSRDTYESYASRIQEVILAAFDSDLPGFSLGWYLVRQIQEDFVKFYGERFRAAYIRRLTWIVIILGVPSLIYGGILSGWVAGNHLLQPEIEKQTRTAAWVICGVCASVWLSFVVRNRQLQWPRLTSLDPDGLSPMTRTGLVLAVTYVFALLLKLNVLSIGVGNLNLTMLFDQPSIAILVGLIGGLGGDALVDLVVGRVQGFARPSAPTRA